MVADGQLRVALPSLNRAYVQAFLGNVPRHFAGSICVIFVVAGLVRFDVVALELLIRAALARRRLFAARASIGFAAALAASILISLGVGSFTLRRRLGLLLPSCASIASSLRHVAIFSPAPTGKNAQNQVGQGRRRWKSIMLSTRFEGGVRKGRVQELSSDSGSCWGRNESSTPSLGNFRGWRWSIARNNTAVPRCQTRRG